MLCRLQRRLHINVMTLGLRVSKVCVESDSRIVTQILPVILIEVLSFLYNDCQYDI